MAEVKIPRSISRDEFLNQVRCGVFDAMHQLMTSGTSTPGTDFYSAVKDGVREAVRATVSTGQLRVVPDSTPEPGAAAADERGCLPTRFRVPQLKP